MTDQTTMTDATPEREGRERATRPLRPPLDHDWQIYMDGEVRCTACGRRRQRGGRYAPCRGAGKVTIDVDHP